MALGPAPAPGRQTAGVAAAFKFASPSPELRWSFYDDRAGDRGCTKFLSDFCFVQSFYNKIMASDLEANTSSIPWKGSQKLLLESNLHDSHLNGICQ